MQIILIIITINLLLFIYLKYNYSKGEKAGNKNKNLNLIPKDSPKEFNFIDVEYRFGVKLSDVFKEMQKSSFIQNKSLDELYDMTITNNNRLEYFVAKKLRVLCHKRLREKAKYHQK